MTATWSSWPLGPAVPLEQLGPPGTTLSKDNGESRRVSLLEQYPGWVFKEYVSPKEGSDDARLRRLIALPGQMDSAADKECVDQHTAWPAARVLDDRQHVVGVVMPRAPDLYSTTITMPSRKVQRKTLHVDLLALPAEEQSKRGITGQALADRLQVCASITAVGAVLERHDVVYLDWSWANVFWSILDHSAFVIDLDGCSFGPRQQIETPGWADPLVPRGTLAGNEVDRYRTALLTARCLTGTRGSVDTTREALVQILTGSGELVGGLVQLLDWSLRAASVTDRPTIAELDAALSKACRGRPAGATSKPRTGDGKDAERVTWQPIPPKVDLRPGSVRIGPLAHSGRAAVPLTPGGTAPDNRRPPIPSQRSGPAPRPVRDVLTGLLGLAMSVAFIVLMAVLASDVLAFLF